MSLPRRAFLGRACLGLGAMAAAGISALADGDDAVDVPIITVPIPRDRKVEVVLGPEGSGQVMMYLHGVCGDPLAFKSWAAAAAAHATLISLRGDEKCEKKKFRYQWSYDFKKLDHRISKAIEKVQELREDPPLDQENVVLMGYSQGAHRVEQMARRYPDRFRRVAIAAPAKEPKVESFAKTERVLLIAGGRDAKQHIKDAHDKLKEAGREVMYLELPGAGHGEYGPEAQPVMAQGLEWLYKNVP